MQSGREWQLHPVLVLGMFLVLHHQDVLQPESFWQEDWLGPVCRLHRHLFCHLDAHVRFGHGIYTSSTSSKSNDYSTNVNPSRLKAVLLNKVVVGKGYKMTQDNTSLTAPPAGYDSVCTFLLSFVLAKLF